MRFLSDKSEFEFGLSVLRPLLKRFADAQLHSPADAIADLLEGRSGYDIYVSCYTDARDSEFHWQAYASGGTGGAVGIGSSALSRDNEALLLRVAYGEHEVAAALTSVINWCISKLREAAALPADEAADLVSGVLTATTVTLFLQVVASKRECFRPESEWRLIHLQSRADPMPPEKLGHYARGDDEVPFVLLPVPRLPTEELQVHEVLVGPRWHESGQADALAMALAARGVQSLQRSDVRVGGTPR